METERHTQFLELYLPNVVNSSHSSEESERGRLAGVDFGTVRIGVAITDHEQRMASPYENYTRRGEQQDRRFFLNLAEQEQIVRFVVGLPVHLSGDESAKSQEARRFGKWLGEVTKRPVEFFDERYSSSEAEQMLLGAELSKKKRKARLDMLAAQIMLSAYLESETRGKEAPQSLDD
ncbi:MAG: Holliday junction resolvase RuvX [Planctomycetota bacterium]|nr:Holliday junction resolvase RuvX [Planctomycetota bacterium]